MVMDSTRQDSDGGNGGIQIDNADSSTACLMRAKRGMGGRLASLVSDCVD